MSSATEHDQLELAISSVIKLKNFSRNLSKPSASTGTHARDTPTRPQQPFHKKLELQLHVVLILLESFKTSQEASSSVVVTLLDNLERLCKKPYRLRETGETYPALKILSKVEDTRLPRLASKIGASADNARERLLSILANISVAPSKELRDEVDSPEVVEQPADFYFPKRLNALHSVLYSNRMAVSADKTKKRRLAARLCLAESGIVNSGVLRAGMLVNSVDESQVAPSSWREAQMEVLPKLTRPRLSASTDFEPLTTCDLHDMIQEAEPSCLCFQIREDKLTLKSKMHRNASNLILVDSPGICLSDMLRPDSMNPRKRLFVCFLLIRAFWHCLGTGWLDEAWTKVHIHFMYTMKSSAGPEPRIFAHQPFLAARFLDKQPTIPPKGALIQPKIRALGIMLLEIELGVLIESRRPAFFLDSHGSANIHTDLTTAQILVPEDNSQDSTFESRGTYQFLRNVIRRCLYSPEFNACRNDNRERSIVYRDILGPIQFTLNAVAGDCKELSNQPLDHLDPSLFRNYNNTAHRVSDNSATSGTRLSPQPNSNTFEPTAYLFDCSHICTEEEGAASDQWVEDVGLIRNDCFEKMATGKRIKIAVLDTGLDEGHPFFQDEERLPRIAAQESFLNARNSEAAIVDSPRDTKDVHGHGTHIAGILLQVSPDADLYIGRVIRGSSPEQSDALRVSQGITWAIEQGVDIITMSLGFDQPNPHIRQAITDAYAKNILVFASASNSGANPIAPIAYPARMSTVICINSSDSLGNKLPTSPFPQPGKENFSAIGAGINSAWPPESMERKSGTSFATPVAAGLTSLVLEYANQRNKESPGSINEELMNTLHTRDGMVKILAFMGEPDAGRFKFLRPWVLWGTRGRRKRPDDVVRDIIRLVENV